ncbi:MAG: hypothetical protein GX058_10050 [Firmicutes bacterium]|nr:hypothetical protein [Bacillota bacterium]
MNKDKKAAALKYDPLTDAAPRVIASGSGEIAERILAIAEAHGIAIHQDSTLVELLAALELNSEIPPELYGIVAEILAFIYRLDQQASTN